MNCSEVKDSDNISMYTEKARKFVLSILKTHIGFLRTFLALPIIVFIPTIVPEMWALRVLRNCHLYYRFLHFQMMFLLNYFHYTLKLKSLGSGVDTLFTALQSETQRLS